MQYTKETLAAINTSYLLEHLISQADLDKVNALSARIEAERHTEEPVPQDGDSVICALPDGAVYAERAHLEAARWLDEGKLTICVQTYTPFIHPATQCSASGGPWFIPRLDELVYVGKRMKTFCTWGHMGGCANGAIDFQAEVNVWKIVASKSRFV